MHFHLLKNGQKLQIKKPSFILHRNIDYRAFSRYSNSSIILGIETSCDDTSVALIDGHSKEIISHVKFSQTKIHQQTDGIVPIAAAKAHQEYLPIAIEKIFRDSGIDSSSVNLIGVTRGPGLASSLAVGLEVAKSLSSSLNIPLLGVHHMAGHALVSRMIHDIPYPFLCLLISGGHSLIAKVHRCTEFNLIGSTLDDSIGEALDKACRYLRIPWDVEKGPGASLEMHAKLGNSEKYAFNLPFSGKDTKNNFNLSFSGLKTALRVKIKNTVGDSSVLTFEQKCDFAAAFQNSAMEHVIQRLRKYLKNNPDAQALPIVVGGGVASNQLFREKLTHLSQKFGTNLIFPPVHLCTDNAVMIAWTAYEWYFSRNSPFFQKCHSPETIRFIPKWQLGKIHEFSGL